jgi:polyisoprenoid-binding protein YceI
MRSRIRATLIAAALVLALAWFRILSANAGSALAMLKLDPANTRITFTLKGNAHNTEGSFKLRRGEIMVDPDTGKTHGIIVVDATSGRTGIIMRDNRMRDSILEAQRYPDISFIPRQAQGHPFPHGVFVVKVSGTFLLHGAQHDATLEVAINRKGDDFTATSRFEIPYVAWGVKDPSLLFLRVDQRVQVEVTTSGHATWLPAAVSPAALSGQAR